MAEGPDAEMQPDADDDEPVRVEVVDGPTVVVRLSGELDAAGSPGVRDHIDRAISTKPDRVAVDLAELDFVDSVGLSVLVTAHHRAAAEGVGFEVRNATGGPRRIIEITGLDEVFTLR